MADQQALLANVVDIELLSLGLYNELNQEQISSITSGYKSTLDT